LGKFRLQIEASVRVVLTADATFRT